MTAQLSAILSLAIVASACADTSRGRVGVAAPSRARRVATSVTAIRIEEGVRFYRYGEWTEEQDVLLVRIDGIDGSDFPLDAVTLYPTFFDDVYTHGVGWSSFHVVPRPSHATGVLWIARAYTEVLTPAELAVLWANAAETPYTYLVVAPPKTPRQTYPTFNHLVLEIAPLRLNRAACEEHVGLQCGEILDTSRFGPVVCEACPSGQVCTNAHRCCDPRACAAAGATCGSDAPACGGTSANAQDDGGTPL